MKAKAVGSLVVSVLMVLGLALGMLGCSTDTFQGSDADPPGDAAREALVVIDAGSEGSADAGSEVSDGDGASFDGFDGFVKPPYRRVFITSARYAANVGSLAAADSICASHAAGASLGGTWMAWLSSSTTSAASRLAHATVPYQLVDGTKVASDWTSLTSGTLASAIDKDEKGNVVPFAVPVGQAWTGTLSDGTASAYTCADWTETTPAGATSGSDNSSSSGWTASSLSGTCTTQYSFYCFEQ